MYEMANRLTDDDLRRVYRETIDALYAYVSRRCGGDRDLAEDVTQETWLRAVRDWHRRGPPDRPIGWLRTVAHNLILNEFRRRRPVSLDAATPDDLLTAMDDGRAHDSADIATVVNRAQARLPTSQSRLFEAFHYERSKVGQIASSLGISERAVEGRLRRARENLRKHLETALRTNGALE
jgi:RNA polymerase sigma-70 factor (ECF subfamily)